MTSGDAQRGFTYLIALLLIAASGFGLAALGEAWSHARQREKEAELRWIGNQFRHAIALYYHRSPAAGARYPQTLEDLIEDRRFPMPQRYLRRIYADPMTGKTEWGLIAAPGGGIMGVQSLSARRDWKFIYEPPELPLQRTIASDPKRR